MWGLQRGTIHIAPADLAWAVAYAEEEQRLRAGIGHMIIDIQHIGSTAIPGLDAKPIIDIAIAIASPQIVNGCRPPLLDLGYQDRGDGGSDGGYLFVKESRPDLRTHHLHIVTLDDPQWANYLRFRDRLRADDTLREAYSALEHQLQDDFAGNRRGYTAAKDPFIQEVLSENSR